MLQTYIKIAIRSLVHNKGYSAITIFGLSIGLAVSLLCFLYVKDELSYDTFHDKSERIYRINSDITYSGKSMQGASAPTPMAQTLKKDFPEVEESTRLGKYGSQLVKSDRAFAREQNIIYADSTIFGVFTLPFTAGNPKKSLTEPGSVVITRQMALKYFGTTDALNRTLVFDHGETRRVTGVMQDMPRQSHFRADFLLPVYETKDAKANKWGNHIFNTYVVLKSGTDPKSVDAKFEKVIQTYIDPALRQYFQTTLAETRKAGNNFSYSLMSLRDIHLYSNREGELSPNGSIQYFYIFLIIGFFILLIAVFNFVNLTTARSSKRAREVGVRKVMGSNRSVLVFQFLSESMLTTFLALLTGIVLLYTLLPAFNSLAARELSFSDAINPQTILIVLAGTVIVGLLAGIYPAFYLSSFQPANALKGSLKIFNNRQGLRSYLVVFQFSMSVLLIIGTLLINQQLSYIRTKKVGFDKEQVLVVKTGQSTASDLMVFKNEVLQNPSVKAGTVSGFLPVISQRWNDMWFPKEQTDGKFAVNMQEWMVDTDYLKTLNLELLEGRNFTTGSSADMDGVIINESAAKRFGYENPVGKTIHKTGDEKATIIGVIKDFHYESLRTKIEPLGLFISSAALGSSVEKAALEAVSFKLDTKDIAASLSSIGKIWKKTAPGKPFEYSFLSEDFDAMYRAEQRIENLFSAFASTAILIACLGLFGLSAFSAEQRTKEIGVRKVLGASVVSITTLLSKDFLKPVLLAIAIASPVGWYAMDFWLRDFAYKVDIQWWVFVLAGFITIVIALLTVSFQSVKAALMNPVESLKTE
ncbi:ABC transporter permease [Dyadobacter diqingensis]|uniref:ABC transporter permease n=1 Tax=Dyadobacter diqingensis TaxID=2938121 RepID=UPI0020C54CBE|nr:ABC transporter permease [Dyadobacter diqingensis]